MTSSSPRTAWWIAVALVLIVGVAALALAGDCGAPAPRTQSPPVSPDRPAGGFERIAGPDVEPAPTAGAVPTQAVLRGRVVQGSAAPHIGEPIAGASIAVDTASRGERTVQTDRSGAYQVDVELATVRALRVDADSFVGEELDIDQVRGAVDRAMVERTLGPRGELVVDLGVAYLEPGRRIAGRVSAAGRGVAGARVRCIQRGLYDSPDRGASVTTDARGEFVAMCGLNAFKLQASHPGYQRAVTDWLPRDHASTDPVDIALVPGVRVTGVVIDDQGSPASGVRVRPSRPDDQRGLLHVWNEDRVALPEDAVTDARGQFAFEPLSGELELTATASDGSLAQVHIELGGRSDQSVELRLDAGNQVAGVVTLDGQPVESVMVGWVCEGGWSEAIQLSGAGGEFHLKQLGQTGRCVVAGKPPDEDVHWNRLGARGGFVSTQVAARIGDDGVVLALTSDPAGSLEIRFRGAFDGYSGDLVLTGIDADTARSPAREEKIYFPASSVAVKRLRAGRYRVTADLSDGIDPAPVDVAIAAGEVTRVALQVPDGFARGKATGRVVDAETGRPLADATVWYSAASGASRLSADASGTFEFDYAAQTLSVTVSADGYDRAEIQRNVGAGETGALGDIALRRRSTAPRTHTDR